MSTSSDSDLIILARCLKLAHNTLLTYASRVLTKYEPQQICRNAVDCNSGLTFAENASDHEVSAAPQPAAAAGCGGRYGNILRLSD
jgi:hypothetical protein